MNEQVDVIEDPRRYVSLAANDLNFYDETGRQREGAAAAAVDKDNNNDGAFHEIKSDPQVNDRHHVRWVRSFFVEYDISR